jgi:formylglycine-generating enzyme required for sulfatase activity
MKALWSRSREIPQILAAVLGALLLFSAGRTARAQSISMSYVTVGNPNNAADSATGSLYGSVSYAYNIGEYDVTDSQYVTFLNAVDPTGANTLALYSPQGDAEYGITFNSGAAGGSKYSVIAGYASMPVVDVDYWSTLRFVNWMNNGEGSASTETGAYTLTGGNTDGYGTPSNASSLLANPQHNAGATVWLPSENEWYKAAYYNPATSLYSTYATQSNTAPGNIIGNGANEANYYTGNGYSVTQSTSYSSSQNYLTAVGSYTDSASYYGTYDQSGDVYNWESTVVSSDYPVVRGGFWDFNSGHLASSGRFYDDPAHTFDDVGFRVASVPEPNSLMLILAAVAGLALIRGKPFKL